MEQMHIREFLSNLKDKKGKDIEKIIEEILLSDIYYFSDFIQLPNIQALNSPQGQNLHYNTLVLMFNQSYQEYKKNSKNYITLSQEMLIKLKIVTILDIARDNKIINYSFLMKALEINTEYELEELLFEIFSKGLLQGDVNAMEKTITIVCMKGRNTTIADNVAAKIIDNWIENLNQVDQYIDGQIVTLNAEAKQFTEKAK